MNAPSTTDPSLTGGGHDAAWHRDNQRHLTLRSEAVTARLQGREDAAQAEVAAAVLAASMVERGDPPALEQVAGLFSLTGFETEVLLAAAAPELGTPSTGAAVTFGAALASLTDPHWSALLPDGPLRLWRLLDFPDALPAAELGGLVGVPLAVDERVLHALVGATTLDPRLLGRVTLPEPRLALTDAHLRCAETIAEALLDGPAGPRPLAPSAPVLVTGQDRDTRRELVVRAGRAWGLTTLAVTLASVPGDPLQRERLARLVAREAGLGRRQVLLEGDDPASELAAMPAFEGLPVVVSVPRPEGADPGWPHVVVPPLTTPERAELLRHSLSRHGIACTEQDALEVAHRYRLTPAQVHAVTERTARAHPDAHGLLTTVSRVATEVAGSPVADLAVHRSPVARLDDLVLPQAAQRALSAVVATVRHQVRVHEEWGHRGPGRTTAVTALFAGPSGTGKSLAAEAVAGELGRDVITADLSQVMSKYIGETEKHLALLFEAAESGAVLVFDEGDALFGRRTAVHDSHDRYANLEVAYLLQRLERFSGIAVITTNARENVDPAFLRRLRFVVTFPFPDAGQRARLWRHAFAPGVPTDDLDPERLAQLAVSGGTIAQLATHAAFLAAEDDAPVAMRHVLAAVHIEADKLERPVTGAEVRGWT